MVETKLIGDAEEAVYLTRASAAWYKPLGKT